MGCDIHLVLETYDDDLGWVGIDTFKGHQSNNKDRWYSPIATDRNYKLFAALAGVRGDGPAPRGIPEDASTTTKLLVKNYGADGHSHSWLPIDEATLAFNERRYPEGETPIDPNGYRDSYPTSYWFGVESSEANYRLIFWFDN
jgi:hypothetical protein